MHRDLERMLMDKIKELLGHLEFVSSSMDILKDLEDDEKVSELTSYRRQIGKEILKLHTVLYVMESRF